MQIYARQKQSNMQKNHILSNLYYLFLYFVIILLLNEKRL